MIKYLFKLQSLYDIKMLSVIILLLYNILKYDVYTLLSSEKSN